jgi:hypothetical protein
MDSRDEIRKSQRFSHKSSAMITANDGYCYYVTLLNFSRGGMYLESPYPIQYGSAVNIEIDKPLFKTAPKSYRATVVWCQELDMEESLGAYGIGVKFS